jgi:peroxiredoxin Q/BCP
MAKPLKDGDKAPAFTLPSDRGGKASLRDYAGKTLVLYFYPKDDTAACTKEAIDFSAKIKAFEKAGASVLGVSKDNVEKHDKFKAKYGLKVALGADEAGKTVEAYGVWVEKSLYGRKYMGIDRATFLIDGAGIIRRIWRKVRVPRHVDEVLEAAKAI